MNYLVSESQSSHRPLLLLICTLVASEVALVSTIGLVCFSQEDAAIRDYLERNHADPEVISMFDPEIETPYVQYLVYRLFILVARVFMPTESLLINCLLQMAIHLLSVILSIALSILIALCIEHFESKELNYHRL